MESPIDRVVDYMRAAERLDEESMRQRHAAKVLLQGMSSLERAAVAGRLGGDWTAEALGWLADGGRHDRRR
jgi:hypothetical protein